MLSHAIRTAIVKGLPVCSEPIVSPGYIGPGYMGSQATGTNLHNVRVVGSGRSFDRSPRRVFGDPLYAVVAESAEPYVGGLTG